jgi:ABC-type oligopeptide transport system ATPase subunit
MISSSSIDVKDLKVHFPIKKGIFSLNPGYVKAVDGVSFSAKRGETLGVVGESGCGKSTTARAILRLVKPTSGSIIVDGEDISKLSGKSLRSYRKKVQAVFQDPLASLNPRHTILESLTEGMMYHGLCDREDCRDAAVELLESVGMDSNALYRYPHEFSGGQRQRICIARAISLKPEFLICDEAVSALDLSIRAQVLDLLDDLKRKLGLGIIFITHDIGVVQKISNRIIVMNNGVIVEQGETGTLISSPRDEYTKRLLDATPRIGKKRRSNASK